VLRISVRQSHLRKSCPLGLDQSRALWTPDSLLSKGIGMSTLWYALFKGSLCRIRDRNGGGLICEVWRNGSWVGGPDFAEVDFTGRMILKEEAEEWIRTHFRQKKISSRAPRKSWDL
jgi:hypothetical protein